MDRKLSILLIATLLAVLFLSGCVAPPPPPDAAGLSSRHIGRMVAGAPFAAAPGGQAIAWGAPDGLRTQTSTDDERLVLDERQPMLLAWNDEGTLLAAIFPNGDEESRLVVYNLHGEPIRDVGIAARVTHVDWAPRDGLTMIGYAFKAYSFGGNLAQLLFRIDPPEEAVQRVVLGDTTLKPATVRLLAPLLARLLPAKFSTHGDELVFARLHDPPEFPPYLQLLYRNLDVHAETLLGNLPLAEYRLAIDRKGVMARAVDMQGRQYDLRLWPGDAAGAGRPGIASYSGRYRFHAGKLYDGESQIVDWGSHARVQFLEDGRCLLALREELSLVTGLEVESRPPDSEEDLTLRNWRYRGLITPADYRRLTKDMQ